MALFAGTRLGPYEIISPIGAGGMGDVYKARDTRLDRLVAIKTLRAELTESLEARERFEREARALSRLSHPHVCALYDVGHVDGTEYLVMELVAGDTLAGRLAKGPLPMAEVLRDGVQICEALSAAHGQGIVHRDLKPGNVMVTPSGVKLLDFGLAKAVAPVLTNGEPGDTVTAARLLTTRGTWVGTAPYMAPEVLRGRPADARSDVFALGAVLYEMATGHRAFPGETSDVITSAILHDDPPPVSASRATKAPGFDRLVRECLAKDPDCRWQSARDIALQLRAIQEDEQPTVVTAPVRRRTAWLTAAAATVVGVALAVGWHLEHDQAPAPLGRMELQLLPPANRTFSYSVETITFAVSPDGDRLAFLASDHRLWLRPLTSVEATPLPGTDHAASVFWSPDGRSLAFFADGTLKRVDLASGAVVTMCAVPRGIGLVGTWGAEGQILFASIEGDAISRVSTAGTGAIDEVKADPSHDETKVLFPSFLPDGRRFLYVVRMRDGTAWLMLGDPGHASRRLSAVESNATYIDPGDLVFARGGALLGQRFDPSAGQLSGEPFAITNSVRFFLTTGVATFAVARSAVVYQSQGDRARLAWVDRSGRELESVGSAGSYLDVRLTSSGQTVLYSRALPSTGTYHVWSLDLHRGTETRLTLDDRTTELSPIQLPGAQAMVYSFARGRAPRLVRRDFATGQEQVLLPPGPRLQEAEDVSPDGKTLAYSERTELGPYNLWTLPLSNSASTSVLRRSPFSETGLRYSPDGRYYSFLSNESGRTEAYVSPVAGGPKTPVSRDGAKIARWSHDGGEIVYVSSDGLVEAVRVRTTPALEFGTPTTLFALGSKTWKSFDISSDGKRFLAIIPEVIADEQPLTAILNWNTSVRR